MKIDEPVTNPTPTVHPTAFIAPSADVVGDVRVGEHASIWYGCVLRGDLEPIHVGAETNIQDLTVVHVDVDRPTIIGKRVGIGHRAIIHGCEVEDDVLIGMGAIILSHAVVRTGSVIAAGALVTEGMVVPPGSLVVGVPGKVVREVGGDLAARIARTAADYKEMKEGHRKGRWRPVGGAGS